MTWWGLSRRIAPGLDRFATRRVILAIGWLAFCVYAYPGYMSTDSVDQLLQARGAPLHDWYPPVMAILWRATDHVVAGPFPMLVIQSVAFLLGLDAILRRIIAPRTAAITASAILVFPAVITQMAVIWKDSQMAGFLIAGAACLLSSERRWRLAGLGLLVLATAQRYNAPAATLPLVLGLPGWRDEPLRWRRHVRALAAWIAITVLAFAANRALTERETHPWHNSLALLDIAGMVAHAPVEVGDAELRDLLAGVPGVPRESIRQRVRAVYRPDVWWPLAHGDDRVFDPPDTEAARDAVAHAWRRLLSAYPGAYVAHRWSVWKWVVGLRHSRSAGAVWDGFTANDAQIGMISHQASHAPLQARWIAALHGLEPTMVFHGWVYLAVALVLLPLCRGNRIAFALLASGIAYELSLLLVAPSADYRYSHWMIICALAAAVLIFAARYRAGRIAASDAGSALPGDARHGYGAAEGGRSAGGATGPGSPDVRAAAWCRATTVPSRPAAA